MTAVETVELVAIYGGLGFVLLVAAISLRRAVKRRSGAPLWTAVPCAVSLLLLWFSFLSFAGSHFSGGLGPGTGLVYVLFGCGLAVLLPAWSLRNDGRGWVHVAAIPVLVPAGVLLVLGVALWAFGVE